MRKTNIYYRAAELLAEGDPFDRIGCCTAIWCAVKYKYSSEELSDDDFDDIFYPNELEMEEYKCEPVWWMYSHDRTLEQNHNDRILALLLMAEITDNP